MKIRVDYASRYSYDSAVSLSPHVIRVFPRADLFARVETSALRVFGDEQVMYRRDLFDNVVAQCFFPRERESVEIVLELVIAVEERNPFAFLLDGEAVEMPFAYRETDLAVLAPFLSRASGAALPGVLCPRGRAPTVERLVGLNEAVFEMLDYERREHGPALEPDELLRRGSGACRDFAVLMAEVLRANGVASRLASGFLWEPETPESERKAEGALHAWVEAYLPGPGWIGLDPTNGVFCDHHAITTAVGLTTRDISPVQGFYYGGRKIGSQMTSSLAIREVA